MAQHAPGIVQQMLDARHTCRELAALLLEENTTISAANGATHAEARLQLKKRLSIRLEKLVQDIKNQRSQWQGNSMAVHTAGQLAEEFSHFQQLARQNEVLLRAAHQIRADIVSVIRDTIDAQQPRVQTYGKSGNLNNSTSGVRVMAKEV